MQMFTSNFNSHWCNVVRFPVISTQQDLRLSASKSNYMCEAHVQCFASNWLSSVVRSLAKIALTSVQG